jgi:arylsulfatase
MRRVLSVLIVGGLLALAGLWAYQAISDRPLTVAIDLADRLVFAARASDRPTLMFGWPDAEPRLVRGFGGDPETRGRERFLWVRQAAALALDVDAAKDRALVFDIEAYEGIPDQRLEVSANGHSLGVRDIPSRRSRVRFDWPASAQSATNRLELLFTRAIVPADAPGGSGDTRDLAAALFSLTMGDPGDKTLDLLLERETPRAFEVSEKDGIPSLVLPGASRTSFAFRLPKNAVMQFESTLHPWSASSGGNGSLEITFDATDSRTRAPITVPLTATSREPVAIAIPGEPGTPMMVTVEVKAEKPGVTFAQVRAPRVLGAVASEPARPAQPQSGNATRLGADVGALKPNVLFIVLDAARAQSFGIYGHSRDTTPNLDRLAREGFTFDNAYTTAAYTLAAMSSVWTSQQPDRHHGDLAFSAKLPKDRLLLAEVLTAQGIHTAGFVANQVAGAFNGFDRGFKQFDEPWRKFGSGASGFRNFVPAFLDHMKKEGSRFFAYVHYREPHEPYDPPPPFDTRFGPDGPIKKERRDGGALAKQWLKDVNQRVLTPSAAEIDHLRRLYDGNLAFADQEVGYLREQLEARGLLDNTLIIVTGDHGEALYEHGYIGHNTQVFEESARVPLFVVLPKAMRERWPAARIASLVDLTDIAPTVLDVFGLDGAGGTAREFQGVSLLSQIEDPKGAGRADSREVLTRTVWDRPIYALRNSSHTFLYNVATAGFSLFDRGSNPRLEGPDHDYAPRAPVALREMYRQNLLAWVARQKKGAVVADAAPDIDPEACEQMKALGYLSPSYPCAKRK